MTPLAGRKVFVAGHRGMLGSAIVRRLATEACEIVTVSRHELDLLDQSAVRGWMRHASPDVVIIAAAKVGGILANSRYPVDFLYNNLVIATNIIEAAHRADVDQLLNLGSSCIYPKFAAQPIEEDSLLTGSLEPTNEWYAIAKIAAIKLAQAYRKQYGRDYISGMPTNLYGPGDNYDLDSSHVLPALIRKAHEAKARGDGHLTIWGSGTPRREFLHVDDCADACIFLLNHYSDAQHINIGSGEDITIADLAELVGHAVGFEGNIVYDVARPDGTPRKLMANERLRAMGWGPRISLVEGVKRTYQDFLLHSGFAQ